MFINYVSIVLDFIDATVTCVNVRAIPRIIARCESLGLLAVRPVESVDVFHVVCELESNLLYSVPGPFRRAFVRKLQGPHSQGTRSLGLSCSRVTMGECSSSGCDHIATLRRYLNRL